MGIIYGGPGGGGGGGGGGVDFNFSGVGAIVSYTIPGFGPQYIFPQSGAHASRPAASAYNIGMVWVSNDLNGRTTFCNFTGLSWEKIASGSAFDDEGTRRRRDQRSVIVATAGDYIGQEARLTDYGIDPGLKLAWLAANAWGLPPEQQKLALQHTAVSCDGNTTEKVLFQCNVPPLRGNDEIIIRPVLAMSGAGNKTLRLKLGGTTLYTQALNNSGDVRDLFIRNRNATNVQVMGFDGVNVYGQSGNGIGSGTVQTNVATVLQVTGQKATSGDAMTLEACTVLTAGGG